MKDDVPVKNGIVIPASEIEITTSRSGGAGGQHVNKTDTRVTIRWNVNATKALSDIQKARVIKNLQYQLTTDGDLIINNSSSRSQQKNKENALTQLTSQVCKALYIPKKRMKTFASKASKEERLRKKTHRSMIKKMRKGSYED